MPDLILDGAPMGSVADRIIQCNGDPLALRPYVGDDGKHYITNAMRDGNGAHVFRDGQQQYQVRSLVNNSTAVLRKNDWIAIDEEVQRVALPRLTAFNDLREMGLQYVIPNGMSKSVFEYEAMTDISGATTSMDGVRRGDNDRPTFDLRGLPLPIIHKDFSFNARQILISRNGGSPLDTTVAGLAAEKVAIEAERYLLGLNATYTYAGYPIYGYTNFPQRMTKVMTLPTAGGWIPATLLQEVLAMRAQSVAANNFGPWMLYMSTNWDQYLDNDYSAAKGDKTLRQRLMDVKGIKDVRSLDYLTGYQALLVQMNAKTIRAVIGMPMTTVQWETQGGMEINFKVMCIMVPQLKYDTENQTGIVHGTAA